MTISNTQFIRWVGAVQADNASCVQNARQHGRRNPNQLYVGRAMRSESPEVGRFGNPFYENKEGRIGAVRKYVTYLQALPERERLILLLDVRAALDEGKFLVCWCAPDLCHAHVLAGWARALNVTETMSKLGKPLLVLAPAPDVPEPPDGWEPSDLDINPLDDEYIPEEVTPGPKFAQSRS